MKLTIKPSFIHGDQRCVRAVAVIAKSKKKGIPRRYQKTWTMKTVAPEFTVEEMDKSIRRTAERWEKSVMDSIAAKLLGDGPKVPNEAPLMHVEPTFDPKVDLLA